MKEYKGTICRGCWELGNNCKVCEKCLDTKPKVLNIKPPSKVETHGEVTASRGNYNHFGYVFTIDCHFSFVNGSPVLTSLKIPADMINDFQPGQKVKLTLEPINSENH